MSEINIKNTQDESPDNVEMLDEDEEPVKKEMKPPLPVPSGDFSRPTVKVTPLVSYVGGEGSDSESDESEKEEEFDLSKLYQRRAQMTETYDGKQSTGGSPASVEEFDRNFEDSNLSTDSKQFSVNVTDQVKLPPEPEGRCSRSLQDKIARMLEKKHRGGISLNEHVQRKKDFRNPSIYEKLVGYCSIDEYGTNYPKSLFNPSSWGPESFYDSLAKAQKEAHDKKEKEKHKKGQVEFIKATKKLPTSMVAAQITEEKQKVSKWDARPSESSKTIIADVPVKKQKPNS